MIFSDVSKKGNSVRLRIIEKRRVLPEQRIFRPNLSAVSKNWLLPSLTQMNANFRWSSPKQMISFLKKNSKCLAKKFLSKNLKNVKFKYCFNTNRKSLCTGNVFTSWMLHLLFQCFFFERFNGVSSWHQIILCRKK